MACYNCNNTPCTSTCGCPQQVKGSCVFYQGANLSCIDVTKGDDYDSILVSLNTLICDLQPPSGLATVVTSDCGNITVSNTTADGITTYDLCISTDITDNITENTNDILALQTCVSGGVADIISDTITITEDSSSDCGRVLKLEIPTPSGTPSYAGIVYNDTTKSGTTGATGDKILKTKLINFDNYLISNGDEIIFTSNGQINGDGANADSVKLELWSGGVAFYTDSFSGFTSTTDVKSSWTATITLTADDVNAQTGVVNVVFYANTANNGRKDNATRNSYLNVNYDATAVDYSDITAKVIYVHDSTSGSSVNFARQLKIEVNKYIG